MADINSKTDALHVEGLPAIDPEAEKALLKKIDRRLIPCVWLMYLMSYVSLSFPSSYICTCTLSNKHPHSSTAAT